MRSVLVVLLSSCVVFGSAAEPPTLRVLNWSYYIDVDRPEASGAERSPTLRAFAAANNCRIDYLEYDAEPEVLRKLALSGTGIDLAIVSPYGLGYLSETKGLARLDAVPGRAQLDERFFPADPDLAMHCLPFLAGTFGIVQRRDLIDEPLVSWRTYCDPPPAQHGRIHYYDDPSVMFTVALLALGCEDLKLHEDNLHRAARHLAQPLRNGAVGLVSADPERIMAALASGQVTAGLLYSGEARQLVRRDPARYSYTVPVDGSEFYVDRIIVPRSSIQQDLARRLAAHLIDPVVHARLAYELGYICPNRAARARLRARHPEWFDDPIANPPPEVLRRTFELGNQPMEERSIELWRRLLRSIETPPAGVP